MNITKGFMNIQSLISNNPGTVSDLGELSPIGFTYSKEKGYYNSSTLKEYDLITFTCVDATGKKIQLTQDQVNHVIAYVNYVRTYLNSRTPPYDIDLLRGHIYAQFINQIANVEIGEIYFGTHTALPQWLSWKHINSNTQYVIWLHDEAFRNQYDEYEIVVVPPIQNLELFFQPTNLVANHIYEQTIDKIMDRAEVAKEGYPETFIRMMRFDFIDPVYRDKKIETVWPVLIYGLAGDNIDSIKDAIAEYIANTNSHTRSEWEHIFPDIYRRTEFIIIPRWDLYSIPNMLTQTGLYSQVIDPVEAINFAKNYISFYTPQHINNNTFIAPYPYKSIALTIINGQFNIEGKTNFRQLFPDYIAAPSTSLDYNRMALPTRDVVYKLEEMLIIAEYMNQYTFIPKTMRRIKRFNKLYLTRLIDNINYVMAPKIAVGGNG